MGLDPGVFITSQREIPHNQDVVISWEANGVDIHGFDLRIGTEAGNWNILNCRLGNALRGIKLPNLPVSCTTLYVELGYLIPTDFSPSDPHVHFDPHEGVLVDEKPFTITRT